MTKEDKIVDRVRKLLELAKSDNVHEAGNAAKQAQVLMSKHAITEAMVDVEKTDDEIMEQIESGTLYVSDSSKRQTWQGRLAVLVCKVNQCQCYWTTSDGKRGLGIIGRPSDANTVRYLFSYLVREIERLCQQEADLRGNPGRTWRNNFRLGAVQEVGKRLREAHLEARAAMRKEAQQGDTLGNGAALVRVHNALAKLDARAEAVEEYGQRVLALRTHHTQEARFDVEARAAGKRAGARIDLSRGGNAGLGSGRGNRRKLGS